MIQRGIAPPDVEDVLGSPDGTIRQSMDKMITVMVNFDVRE